MMPFCNLFMEQPLYINKTNLLQVNSNASFRGCSMDSVSQVANTNTVSNKIQYILIR